MKKFMNAELIRIRDNLRCGHCEATFCGSDSQAWKVKYEQRTVYCSDACRHAAARLRLSKPIPNRGPCKTCGKEFFSRTAKIFCTLECYVKSEDFKKTSEHARRLSLAPEARAKLSNKLKRGVIVSCLECGAEVYQKKHRARKFCGTACYRSHLAKRFDRWVANPEGMALPQCYDEFLDRNELTCVIEGCDWRGRHLTVHINQAHGLRADAFKRAAGFNLSTGVVSSDLHAKLVESNTGKGSPERLLSGRLLSAGGIRSYSSKEGAEHRFKARALAGNGPKRTCTGCGKSFDQSTPFGRALYCSRSCRDLAYRENRRS